MLVETAPELVEDDGTVEDDGEETVVEDDEGTVDDDDKRPVEV